MLYEIRFSHYLACTLPSAMWYHAACKRLVLNTTANPPYCTQPHSYRPLVIYTHTHTHTHTQYIYIYIYIYIPNIHNNTYGTVCLVRRTSFHIKKERLFKQRIHIFSK